METSNQDRPPPSKSHLWDVCIRVPLDYEALQSMNEQAGVPARTIEKMVLGDPVRRSDAEKILAVVSRHTGSAWTLENLSIPLRAEEPQKPKKRLFFVELWHIHQLRAEMVAPHASVSEEVIYAMVRNAPVTKADAEKVLAQLSSLLKQQYTLETVYVSLLKEGEEDATEKDSE